MGTNVTCYNRPESPVKTYRAGGAVSALSRLVQQSPRSVWRRPSVQPDGRRRAVSVRGRTVGGTELIAGAAGSVTSLAAARCPLGVTVCRPGRGRAAGSASVDFGGTGSARSRLLRSAAVRTLLFSEGWHQVITRAGRSRRRATRTARPPSSLRADKEV